MLVFKNAVVVNGDGKTLQTGANVVVENERIVDVTHSMEGLNERNARIVDCTGKAVLPGLINHHTHSVVMGPFLSSGAAARTKKQVLTQLDRDLLNGHTTVMGVDGFVTMEEVKATQELHPVRIKTAAVQLPKSFLAADCADGAGLDASHRAMTLERMLADGAVAIGEVGSGQTTGGGDYVYIPRMVKERKGATITADQSYAMFLSVLGTWADRDYYRRDRVLEALKECGLEQVLSPEECRDIVYETTFRVYDRALDAYEEAVEAGIRYDVPVILHHTPSTTLEVQRLARRGLRRFIPSHSNCLFTVEEALDAGRKLRSEFGVWIDGAVFDSFSRQLVGPHPDVLTAMFREGLIDLLSTDFSGGQSDSMLKGIAYITAQGAATLPAAVAAATSNVAMAIPGIAPGLGMVKKGYTADLIVVDYPEVSRLRQVYIGGRLVAEEGKTRYEG
ncbi:amidohydrolase family protein [Oscillibacter sp. MSJ-2]|uniref:Amidohydrolase family protein n=1 Tax=Dysosmobacter acutus TaxID=2841504 RepID=A0ABS6F8L0_9FIRM|nr:amidohydrolase family protein [Dysosmobacter acutus]MBU5626611.1 amidohydrolase family protein [Dysosmobacter acutus]